MKNIKKILLGTLALLGLQFVLVGCLVGGGGYYDGGGPWFHDGPWLDGGRWGGGDARGGAHVDVHPPGLRR
jgi:hypothetical protein